MREILFRGKKVDSNEWVVSDCFYQCSGIIKLWENYSGWVEVIPETIGQFTGLKDNRGEKIFEGDIVEFLDIKSSYFEDGDEFNNRGVIEYGGNNFYITNRETVNMDELVDKDNIDCIIVGNIYDTPKLIED